jgi:nucleotide-binding universal stress UspA family protein
MIQSNTEFKTILVPLDGSAHSEHALPHALSIARRNGATIRLALVHAPITPSDDPWDMYHRDFLVDIDEDRVREKQNYLNSVVRRIKQRDTIRVVTLLAEGDRTADELCSAAQGADLIVMATHARGRLAKLWHGSMADALLRRVNCPLLLVRGYPAPADLTGDPLPGKVLAPLDGSLFSEQILPATAEIARISNADVRLLHVDRFPVVEGMTSDPGSYLRSASTSVADKAPYVEFEVAETYESPAAAVLASAREQRADLIALTTRARHSLSRWGRASILDAVLQRSAVPVLVMRGEEALRTKKRTASSATAV